MVTPLRDGTRLRCAGGEVYVIRGLISRGGTSFLYRAAREGSDAGSYAIKEACPHSDSRLVRAQDLTIQPETPSAEDALALCRGAVLAEKAQGLALHKHSSRTLCLFDRLAVEEVLDRACDTGAGPGEGVFCIFSDVSGQGMFLSERIKSKKAAKDRFSFLEAASMIRNVLAALQDLHLPPEGAACPPVLHGDLSTGNIFFERAKNGPVGEAFLADFGCVRPIDPATGATEPVGTLFSSPQYVAPEMHTPGVRLTTKSDIYQVGCLLLAILNKLPLRPIRSMGDTVTTSMLIRLGASREAANRMKKLLAGCLCTDVEKRFDVTQALALANEICAISAPPAHRIPTNLETAPGLSEIVMRSRKEELAWLTRTFRSASEAFLFGVPGIGKTELAIAFARTFPGQAYRIEFEGSMKNTMRKLHFSGLDDENDISKKLDILAEQYQGALLVVDHVDSDEKQLDEILAEKTFRKLRALPLKLLITTRCHPDTIPATPELLAPDHEVMLEHFRSILHDSHVCLSSQEEAYIPFLAEALQYHPLAMELAARSISADFGAVSVEQLINALDDLKHASLPEVVSDKDGQRRTATIYQHLALLLRFSNLTKEEKRVLCHAALLPAHGLDKELFSGCEKTDEKEALQHLCKRRLLRCDGPNLRMHPMIRVVVLGKLKPKLRDCRTFLDRLWKKLTSEITDFRQYQNVTDVFYEASILFDDQELLMRSSLDGIIDCNSDLDIGELLEQHLDAFPPSALKAAIVGDALISYSIPELYEPFAETASFFPKERRTAEYALQALDQFSGTIYEDDLLEVLGTLRDFLTPEEQAYLDERLQEQ